MPIPRIEAVSLNANRNIEIEPDLHPELNRARPTFAQLRIGHPLHELDKLDFVGTISGTKLLARCIVRLLPLPRPLPPRHLELTAKNFETRKSR